ncbi:TonB-dependent receptor [Filimonas lacunae]|uniref:TonB-dependent receptor n=1 Tax=Filimonas lacunae TaxID=477680 RepID=A0A173MDR1_9BACT|nr:TonB-dependent receptor [Filimonas lacunae]BAV05657.1 TonB-dependent receptor [Filimonas lacunae]SIT29018.1 TonB-dependent receptor [Filimonas lacunae]
MAAFQRGFSSARAFVLLCLGVCMLTGVKKGWAQETLSSLKDKVSISIKNANAAIVLQSLQQQTSYTFSFDNTAMQSVHIDSVHVKTGTLGSVLKQLHDKAGLQFSVMPNKNIGVQKGKAPLKEIRITGQIIDQKSGLPVVGATVVIGKVHQTSDVEGKYSILLTPGTYTAEVSFVGYQGKKITDIVVGQEEIASMDVILVPETGTLSGVMVSAGMRRETVAALYVKQKNNVAISDGISAEQIRATSDNNAGQVLKRVSGVVVQNDKFVTIRGVSERYNNVLINGAMLPSTEPNRRNFSFDIVPSSMIDNIVINKTATPDMPSEFSGGFVQINTKDVPAKNFLSITVGSGFNGASVGRQMKDHKRYGGDYLTLKGSERNWFGTVLDRNKYAEAVVAGDKSYMAEVGSKIANRWGYYQYPYTPVQNYQIGGGMLFKFKNSNSLGFTGGATYRNEQSVETGEKANVANYAFQTERYRFTTTVGALFNTAFKTQHHKIAFKNLYNRKFNSQFDYDEGHNYDGGQELRNTVSNILITDIVQNRVEGEHVIGKNAIRIDWFADRNVLHRDQPDTRYIRGVLSKDGFGTPYYLYNFSEITIPWGALYASALKETRKNTGVNVAVPFTIAHNAQQIKAGFAYSARDAVYNGSAFRVLDAVDGGVERYRGLAYNKIATQEGFANGFLYYKSTYVTSGSSTGDGYTGKQNLNAYYLMGDFRLMQQLRVTGGMRYEKNDVTVNTLYQLVSAKDSASGGALPSEKKWLPSVNLIYNVSPKMNIRASYGETLARPDFVERSPFVYYDFTEQLYVNGSQGLKTTSVKNYDVRFEYYATGNEVASVSFFYKKFLNPVERFFYIGVPSSAVAYNNLDAATVKGIELDFRKGLYFIGDNAFWKNLYITGNYSYLSGKIEASSDVKDSVTGEIKKVKVVSNRPVQGLSPYVVNLGLNYVSKNVGFNISYNRFGRRIVYGGTDEALVQYEVPRDVLDLQLSFQLIRQKLELRLNASDILNQSYIIYCNAQRNVESGGLNSLNADPKGLAYNPEYDFINYKVKKGANYSFVITYKF